MFESAIQQVGAALTLVVTVLALWKGGGLERTVALASGLAFLLSPVVQNWEDLVSPQWGVAAVDAALLAVLTGLLIRFDRRWMQTAWAVVALSLLAHVGKIVDVGLLTRGYIGSLYVLYFAFLAALSWGVAEAWRARSRDAEA